MREGAKVGEEEMYRETETVPTYNPPFSATVLRISFWATATAPLAPDHVQVDTLTWGAQERTPVYLNQSYYTQDFTNMGARLMITSRNSALNPDMHQRIQRYKKIL